MNRLRRFLPLVSPVLTAIILVAGLGWIAYPQTISTPGGGTSIDGAACATTTANSLCTRVNTINTSTGSGLNTAVTNIGGADPGGAVVTNSYLDRLLRGSALSTSDSANSLSKLVFDNDRFLMGAAISGATASSVGDLVNKFASADLGGAITTNSALDRIRIWKSIQQGTIAYPLNGTATSYTATITSVTAANSVILFGGCTSADAFTGASAWRIDLTNATTVTMTRTPTAADPAQTCGYTVLELK